MTYVAAPLSVHVPPSSDAMLDYIREQEIAELLEASADLGPEFLLQLAQHRMADLDTQIETLMEAMSATTADAQAVSARIVALRDVMTTLEPTYGPGGEVNLNAEFPGAAPVAQNGAQFLDELVAKGEMTADERDLILSGPDGFRQLLARRGGDGTDILRGTNTHNAFISLGYANAAGDFLADHTRTVPLTADRWLRDRVADGTITEEQRLAIGEGREALNNIITQANDELREINSGNEMQMIKLQSVMQSRTAVITAITNLLKAMDEGNDAVVANLR